MVARLELVAALALGAAGFLGCNDDGPGDECRQIGGPVLPAGSATGTLEFVGYDWVNGTFEPFGDPEIDLDYGPQDADFCMIQPSLCLEANWLSAETECLRVSWTNEILEPPAGGDRTIDETPSLGVRFYRAETPDGVRHCATHVWNAISSCDLGGALLGVSADVQDAHGHHAQARVELSVLDGEL